MRVVWRWHRFSADVVKLLPARTEEVDLGSALSDLLTLLPTPEADEMTIVDTEVVGAGAVETADDGLIVGGGERNVWVQQWLQGGSGGGGGGLAEFGGKAGGQLLGSKT